MKFALITIVLLAAVLAVQADVYMHNPRGSNNRCDENNNNRNNNNKLMNTQNNGAGGYAVAPPLYFHAGSVLSLEWTSQHACGLNGKDHCEIVWQYSCSTEYKDGASTDVEGDGNGNTCTNEINAGNQNDDNVGRHESLEYHTNCDTRERNEGLFTAAENVNNNNGAQATRQNTGGGGSGFECQEERDYYPYWHPTPFVDVAIMTSNLTRCDYYQAESQNVVARWYCSDHTANHKQACNANGATWTKDQTWKARDAPECVESPWGRDNHLGASTDGFLATYNWTIPDIAGEQVASSLMEDLPGQDPGADTAAQKCFVRIRYNVSSMDYDPWSGIDSGSNGAQSPVQDDPYVQFGDMVLRLAIDTNQFGRTFQDRSYMFQIKAPVDDVALRSTVWNLNVRGKRGNIAQVRNCVEYDYSPQLLVANSDDHIHFQWTGSNHNPAGNAGEGRNKWDRSNMVMMRQNDLSHAYHETYEEGKVQIFEDAGVAHSAAYLNQDDRDTPCKTLAELEAANDDQAKDNCAKLNGGQDGNGVSTGYFDLGVHKMNTTGTYNYMGTRNNNFTNRGQKGILIVQLWWMEWLLYIIIGLVILAIVAVGGVFIVLAAVGGVGLLGVFGGGAAVGAGSGGFKRSSSRSSMNSGSSRRSKNSRSSGRSKGSFGRSMI